MTDGALVLRTLSLRRAYGAELPLRAEALGPGVNVVYGPNGLGKTTLGRALQAVVWPETARALRGAFEAEVELAGRRWAVERDGERLVCRVEGAEGVWPVFDATHRARYWLALPELLASDDGDLAQAIRRQAEGGMDVEQAARSLDFREARGQRSAATAALEAAQKRLQDLQAERRSLHAEALALEALDAQIAEAEAAAVRARVLERAALAVAARDALDDARRALAALPEALSRMDGTEHERAERLRETLAGLAVQRTHLEAERAEAERFRTANRLVRAGADAAPVAELRTRARRLREAERDEQNAATAREAAARREADAWASAADLLAPDAAERLAAPERLTAEAVRALERFALQRARLVADARALDALRRVLGEEDAAALAQEAEALADGVRALRDWLRAANPSATALRPLAWGGAAGLAVLAVTLAVLWYPAAAALLLGALALALLPLVRQAGGPAEPEARYRRLALEPPAAWTEAAVAERLDVLERRHADLLRRLAMAGQREALASDSQDLADRHRTLSQDQEALRRRLGVEPAQDPAALVYALNGLAAWQQARRDRLAAEAGHEAAQAQCRAHREALARLLAAVGRDPVADAEAAEAAAEAVDADRQALDDLDRQLHDLDAALERLDGERRTAQQNLDALRDRLGAEDDEAIRALCARVDAYTACAREVEQATGRCRQALDDARREDGFSDDLLERSPSALDAERAERLRQAEALATLRDERTRIRTTVEAARQSTAFADARAAAEDARRALTDEFEGVADRVVGHLLAGFVAEVARERQLPTVFHRARDLFLAFTRHAYELHLGRDGAFFARDTLRERDLALGELSSGTRVQLLLAVRMAFVEQVEQGTRLPVVLDEALANSDDDRARAVMGALFELARQGRQIVYLSAQADEVRKWQEVAGEHAAVPLHLVALDATRELPPRSEPLAPLFPPLARPDGLDHAAYGRALAVPPWQPWDPPGRLHAWYLIDCPQRLHEVLARGFAEWGRLASALRRGRAEAAGLDEPLAARLEVLAEALAAWCEAWRIGRGRPVDRAVLEACDAISAVQLDRVAEFCESVGGAADALLAGLRDRQVPYFRTERIDDVEAYLEEHGHLDRRPPLDAEACWARTVEAVAARAAAVPVPLAEVRRFIARVHEGPARA